MYNIKEAMWVTVEHKNIITHKTTYPTVCGHCGRGKVENLERTRFCPNCGYMMVNWAVEWGDIDG